MHEMGHILGIGTIWEDLGLLSGAGGSNPIFVGANAPLNTTRFSAPLPAACRSKTTGGSGTRDSHWRESVLTTELMTGWAGPGAQHAALEDHDRFARRYRLHGELRGRGYFYAVIVGAGRCAPGGQ